MIESPKFVFKLIFYCIIIVSFSYLFNLVNLTSFSIHPLKKGLWTPITGDRNFPTNPQEKTQLHHVVFGIAASSKLWEHRKNYIRLWWEPDKMRGYVWLDKPVSRTTTFDNATLPSVKISSDTSEFKYKNLYGDRSAIRITRIVSETVRLGLDGVRWIVLGDDDTFFFADNLVRVLSKYDHNRFYYIGKSSETLIQNTQFSSKMAFGGAGFAISYSLARKLEKIQDQCIKRYPELYGSDDRIHACMAELGVPLTVEEGFHQFDIRGNAFGLLAAHPVTPLVSLHHLDMIEPIFPDTDQIHALERLKRSMRLDSAGLMQQSICYDKARGWTISVSWGFAAQIFRGIIPARIMEVPLRSFFDLFGRGDPKELSFNTRTLSIDACQRPISYVLSTVMYNWLKNLTVSEYVQIQRLHSECNSNKKADPSQIWRVQVYKMPNPNLWDEPPRRSCCRVLPSTEEGSIAIDIGKCKEDEIIDW